MGFVGRSMKYNNITEARFINRPNRFIAYVELNGKTEKVHVKNTGRCRELLQPGVIVYLVKSGSPARSTAYDLVAVKKGNRLINIDSQAPNKAVEEWLRLRGCFPDLKLLRPETVYGKSRFDFYLETETEKVFMEVKGVTLENEGIVRFPDAPSERAVKHLEELVLAKNAGYRAIVMFVIQMENVDRFEPAGDIHPEFEEALCRAVRAGVEVFAYDCRVEPDGMTVNLPVPLKENLRLAAIPKPLLEWYDRNKRILPWREAPTPYRVWVSEIMLQQTRVEAVKPYFERFMSVLPDVRALAEAEEEQLLKLWEGLGYYNRVKNLQKAAIQLMEEYGGEMPDQYEELLKLTGIGSYTAGAIASIAYGRRVPAVDGNVLRVLARVRKDGRLITDGKVKAAVEKELAEAMPEDRPGDFNQAMMEIGACVCIPNGAPLCGRCPLNRLCMAHMDGTETEFPQKEAKKPRRIEEKTVLVIRDENRTAIRKRPAGGLLAGMYEFPMLEGCRTVEEITAYLAENGIRVLRVQPLEDAKHIFTHKEWHMKGYLVRVDELEHKSPGEDSKNWLFVEPRETEQRYPMPSALSAYTRYLQIRLGKERYSSKEE